MSPRIGIITQARMGSTRLPGKIFKSIKGTTLLQYHLNRLKDSQVPVFVATTNRKADDVVAEFCNNQNVPFYRGSEDDVLSRFYHAAKQFNLDVIVRVTSDCPLVDGSLILNAIEKSGILDNPAQYVSNVLKRTFPRGLDFEIFSFQMLEDAYVNAIALHEREHVTPFIYEKAKSIGATVDLVDDADYSSFRLTVDTPEDFELINVLIRDHNAHELSRLDLYRVLDANPALKKINSSIIQKAVV